VLRIDDTPGHGRRAGPVLLDEARGETARLGVQDIGDVALLPKLHRLGLVRRRVGVTHPREEIAKHLAVGMGEFHELEPVGSGGVLGRDGRAGRVVREGSHVRLLRSVRVRCAQHNGTPARRVRVLLEFSPISRDDSASWRPKTTIPRIWNKPTAGCSR
jgi:hypothetical protein